MRTEREGFRSLNARERREAFSPRQPAGAERLMKNAPHGKARVTADAPIPYIPPSRCMELMTERQVKRFTDAVRARRRELAGALARAHPGRPREYAALAHALGRHNALVPRMAGGRSNPGAESRQGVAATPATMAEAALPFDQASKRGIESGPLFSLKPGAGTVNLGVNPLPAQGYMRMVEINLKTTAAGEKGEAVLGEDYPWNILELIRMQDTNGNQLDDLPGFTLFLDNVFGGFGGNPDPRRNPDFKAEIEKTNFQLLVARELAANSFGSIANLSASQAYKLTLKIAPESLILKEKTYKAAPTWEVTVWMHFWQLPEPVSLDGRPQVQTPPFHGTTTYRWWAPANSVTQNVNLKIEQVGNEIRLCVLVARKGSGATAKRENVIFPEPLQLRWDTEFLLIAGQQQLRKIAQELSDFMEAYPAGCIVLPFNFGEGRYVGGAGVNSWLPTVTGTRLQVTGTAETAAAEREIGVYVNDVSVAETNPAMRPVAHGPGGYTPQVAPRLAGTG